MKLKQVETTKAEREMKRRQLIDHGVAYARHQLDHEDDLDGGSIAAAVRRQLEEELTATSTRDEAEELADNVIDDELERLE